MKIAIPTDDGIHISSMEMSAKGVHVFTVELGEITGEELRWRSATKNGSNHDGLLNCVEDCSILLVHKVRSENSGNAGGIRTLPARETIITKIIWDYLSGVVRQEANTCCCP